MRVIVLISGACVGFIACGCGGDGTTTGLPPAEPTTAMARGVSAHAAPDSDQSAIEAALADLLTLTDSPLAVRGAPPAQIRFAEEPATYPVKVERILMRRDEEKWAALSEWELTAAMEAAKEVVRRHKGGEGFEPFQPRDPRVKLHAESPVTTRRSRFDRPVQAWPPGYAADGQYAVVFLTIPWSMHSADATYLLKREGGRWRVLLRQFVYYF